jgi:hypothetical protein
MLNKSALKNNLKDVFEANAQKKVYTPIQFAQDLVSAYKDYALQAQDLSNDSVLTFPGEAGAVSAISAGTNNANVAATFAAIISNALVIFWTAATFKTVAPPPGWLKEILSIVTVPGTPAISLLTAAMIPSDNVNTTAGNWADALDTYTKTVIVTITGLLPGSPPVPAPPLIGPIK